MKRYRKKPVVVEAVQLTEENFNEAEEWCDGCPVTDGVLIFTLEGDMRASIGDYIIKGVKGEFYPCKPDIFEATYEEAGTP